MAVAVFELSAQGNKRLDVSSRANDVNDDIEGRWSFGRPSDEVGRGVCRGWRGFGLLM